MRKQTKLVLIGGGCIVGAGLVFALIRAELTGRSVSTVDCATQNAPEERVLGLIVQDKKVLTVKLGIDKSYSPPGGHLEPGEDPKQALERELAEEIGVTASQQDMLPFDVICIAQKGGWIEKTYYYRITSWKGPIALKSSRDKYKWVSSDYQSSKGAGAPLKHALYMMQQANLIE